MPPLAAAVHRLPRALLVAALTALAFGGLFASAQAADGAEDGSLRLPQPAIGDRWAYQALVEGEWKVSPEDPAAVGQPFAFAELEWLEPVLVRDAAGREAAADLLHMRHLDYSDSDDVAEMREGHYWVPQEDRYLYRLGEPAPLAHESRVKSQQFGSTGSGGIGIGGVTALQTDQGTVVEGWARSFEPIALDEGDLDSGADVFADGACLARNAGQGQALDLDEPLELALWDCLPTFPDSWPGDGRFHFAGRERVAGYDAYRFDNGHDASVWLSPAIPVPVQMKGFDAGSVAVLTLSSFEAGARPLGSLSPQVGTSVAPAVELAPRQPWGPDDAGVDHPWPASAAYKAALADPTWSGLRAWTASHPDGVTFWLEYAEDLESTPQQRAWYFGLGDGTSTFAFIAVRQSFDGVPGPLGPATATVRYQDLGFMSSFLDALNPDPALLPAQVPTVASTLGRWASFEALEGRPADPNGWGMSLFCILDCSYGVFGDVVAGRDPVAIMNVEGFMGGGTAVPGGLIARAFTGSQLAVGPEGDTVRLVNWTGYDSGLDVAALGAQAPVDPSAEPAEEERPLLVAAFLPTPGQGAAIGAAASLAGLLYWLWPTLKGGAAGLFSRVAGPRLLEHPARAALLEIIRAEPGIHFQDLVRRSGLPNGTAVHHLRKLEEGGLIAVRPLGRYTCYFPGSSPTAAALEQAPVLRSPGARLVFGTIQGSPGLSGLEIASRVGLGASTVNYHVQRLLEVGLVSSVRDGRLLRLHPAS